MSQSSRTLVEKWGPLLEHSSFSPIQNEHRKAVTATLLENTERALMETGDQSINMTSLLQETPTNFAGTGGFGAISIPIGLSPLLLAIAWSTFG